MKKLMSLCALAAAALWAQPAAEEGKRIALVIGNDTYSIRPLQNAVNDARAMEKALQGAGFKVIKRENATKAAMEEAVSEFLFNIGPNDIALIFYAGHAIQVGGENVLIPTDFESARSLIDAKLKSFSLKLVFDELKGSKAKSIIVILDACRTNPVAETYQLKAGLADPTGAAGARTYIAFSTQPGNVASDNPNGTNSWFTEALADAIAQPNLSVDDVFIRVRKKVEDATGGKQTPWSNTSLTSKFYFHPPTTGVVEDNESIVAKWLDDMLRNEQYENWPEAMELAERIIKQKPGGSMEEAARTRLPYLKTRYEAETKFDAGEFAAAAAAAEAALKLDPFAVDAGLEAANSALLTADLKRAVAALEAVRQRGATPDVQRADTMLKELAAAEPAAAEALKRGLMKPPPLGEVFPGVRFGVPDWEAGRRWARQPVRVDYAGLIKQLPPPPVAAPKEPAPAPAPAAAPAAEQPVQTAAATPPPAADEPRITLDDLYVEVKSIAGARDLISEEFGELTVRSTKKGLGVMLDGKAVARQLPYTLRLPAGEYELRLMEAGRKTQERRVRIRANVTADLDLQ